MSENAANVASIGRLKDNQEIRELLTRYCRGADRGDFDLVLSCFHTDGQVCQGGFAGSAKEYAKWLREVLGEVLCSQHVVSNFYPRIDGDMAVAETYMSAVRRMDRNGELVDVTDLGRCLDRLERRAGRWGISQRTVVLDLTRVDPVGQGTPRPGDNEPRQSRRDKSDPSYALFAWFDDKKVSSR